MVHTHERVCTYHHLASGYHFTFFLSLFFFVCQNVVCKCCTSNRRSFGYCPFIPRLKKMFHSVAPPFFSTDLHFVLIPQYSITSCSMWNLLYQFLYDVECPLICLMPLIRWTYPLSLRPRPCFHAQLVRHLYITTFH